jgi:uncharacterized protein YydD (DUF2326 family)
LKEDLQKEKELRQSLENEKTELVQEKQQLYDDLQKVCTLNCCVSLPAQEHNGCSFRRLRKIQNTFPI